MSWNQLEIEIPAYMANAYRFNFNGGR